MKKIEGSPKNLKQLLQNTKYSIHYYQREYMWQRKHIEELVDDLTSEFLEYYKIDDPRQAVADYGLGFKPYAQFGKAEITDRIQLLVQLVNLVWNTEMFN